MYLALTGDRLTGFDVYRAEISTAHCPADSGEMIAANLGQLRTRYSTQLDNFTHAAEFLAMHEEHEFDDNV